jgi:chromosome segregation ATPase
LERAAPLAILFELAYARFYERDARFEAVSALHDVTTRMRAEHASAVAGLEREVERLRAAQRAGTSDVIHKLRDAVGVAERRAIAAEQRLVAVEGQVVNAVDRLERTHVQLHHQDATLRAQADLIRQLEARLAELDRLAPSTGS